MDSKIAPLLLIVVFSISSAARTKRQIVFEDDSYNRLPNFDCETPDRRFGRCLVLSSCTELLETVSRYRLRRYMCGFEGSEPKVCCPQSDATRTTARPVRTTLRPERTTVRPIRTTSRPIRTTSRPIRTTPRTVRTTRRTTVRTTTRESRNTVRFTEDPRDIEERFINPDRTTPMTRPSFLPRTCGFTPFTKPRVVGGREADKGSWPWMAVVFVQRGNGNLSPDCGGALVTERHVITAAHCVVTGRSSRILSPSRIAVWLGGHNLNQLNESGALLVGVEDVRRHEQFESRTYKNDIAVLKLARPVSFTDKIAPVCLPYDSLRGEDLTSNTVYVIGYGTTKFNGNASDILMEASFDIQDQELCKRAYEPEVQFTEVYLCAGMLSGEKDACQGDSGGPLLAVGKDTNYYLVGVVSFGKECGKPGYPGVYTRVTEFLDWLRPLLRS